ncbi:glycosyltransferase family 39 protein [Sphingobium sp. AP49]|uniref:ArnT family glycosyltransferase n=1 Tax=Sphingobium sp. AP49 TaxID=1144307 RepID=UPI001EE68BFC|nr:glycosyltransferase family 39 protein [Sphingobium sp. AP49]WHO37216.1 glycosyltransferase family 39 protein [Sphingobium sp. AP49]
MYRFISTARADRPGLPVAGLIVAILALWFLAAAIAAPFDHDESQYVAGAYFSARLTIFRDFAYLQPPLHAWTLAPLSLWAPGHMVLAMRLATALMALASLGLIAVAQRIAGISRFSATLATLLVAATAAFQFTASVVRNDMLATLLASAAMLITLQALRRCNGRHWIAAGIFYGLAIATKLNFAPLGLAVGLFVITAGGRGGMRAAMLLAFGSILGMGPLLLGWIAGPEGFVYGVLTYGMTAPHAWYAANGAAHELGGLEKATDLLKYLWKGPALAALLLQAANRFAMRGRVRSPGRRLAIWMAAGALIGAALPTPTQIQYLMPLLPPLALALGYMLDDARHWPQRLRVGAITLMCVATIPGMLPAIRDFAAVRHGAPLLQAEANAHWLGRLVRASGGHAVLTLSPHLAVDSGLAIDARTATGPFVYRTGWTIDPAKARRLHMLAPATLPDLDRAPPAAILTGYENGTRKLPLRPDESLIRYALRRGYHMVPMPDGVGRLYLRD